MQEAAAMSLGNSLFNAQKKSGLSQEEVAEKLGSADRPSPNGNWMKHCRISGSLSAYRYFTI